MADLKNNDAFMAACEKYVELTSTIAGIGDAYSNSIDFISNTVYSLYNSACNGTDYEFSYTKNAGAKAVTFDASVWHKNSKRGVDKPFYTAYSCISLDSRTADLNRLAEDLSMMTYKMHGGTDITYTPDLVDKIHGYLETLIQSNGVGG